MRASEVKTQCIRESVRPSDQRDGRNEAAGPDKSIDCEENGLQKSCPCTCVKHCMASPTTTADERTNDQSKGKRKHPAGLLSGLSGSFLLSASRPQKRGEAGCVLIVLRLSLADVCTRAQHVAPTRSLSPVPSPQSVLISKPTHASLPPCHPRLLPKRDKLAASPSRPAPRGIAH